MSTTDSVVGDSIQSAAALVPRVYRAHRPSTAPTGVYPRTARVNQLTQKNINTLLAADERAATARPRPPVHSAAPRRRMSFVGVKAPGGATARRGSFSGARSRSGSFRGGNVPSAGYTVDNPAAPPPTRPSTTGGLRRRGSFSGVDRLMAKATSMFDHVLQGVAGLDPGMGESSLVGQGSKVVGSATIVPRDIVKAEARGGRPTDYAIQRGLEKKLDVYRGDKQALHELRQRIVAGNARRKHAGNFIAKNVEEIGPPTCPRTYSPERKEQKDEHYETTRQNHLALQRQTRQRQIETLERTERLMKRWGSRKELEEYRARQEQWCKLIQLSIAGSMFHAPRMMLMCYKSLRDHYLTQRRYFRLWYIPTNARMRHRRLKRIRFRLLSGFCVAILWGHIAVRRKKTMIISSFLVQVREAGSLVRAMRLFWRKVLVVQNVFREHMCFKLTRIQMTILQWNSMEVGLRAELGEAQRAERGALKKGAKGDMMKFNAFGQSSGSMTTSSRSAGGKHREDRGKEYAEIARRRRSTQQSKAGARRDNAKGLPVELQNELRVKDLLANDPVDYHRWVPFSIKMRYINQDWVERRQHYREEVRRYEEQLDFYEKQRLLVDPEILAQEEQREKLEKEHVAKGYAAPTMASSNTAPLAPGLRRLKKPKKPFFRIFIPPDRVRRLVSRALDKFHETMQDLKRTAAEFCVRHDRESDYEAIRDANFDDYFKVEMLERKRFFERYRQRTKMPPHPQVHVESDKEFHAHSTVLSQSTFGSSGALGDSFGGVSPSHRRATLALGSGKEPRKSIFSAEPRKSIVSLHQRKSIFSANSSLVMPGE